MNERICHHCCEKFDGYGLEVYCPVCEETLEAADEDDYQEWYDDDDDDDWEEADFDE